MRLRIPMLLLAATLAMSNAAIAAERTVTLKVDNMTCALCGPTVRKALERVPGVAKVSVNTEKEIAVVTYDDAKATTAALVKATTEAGYPSRVAQ